MDQHAAGAKRPDRNDFRAWGEDVAGRMQAWRQALGESQRLADEFAALVGGGKAVAALPLQ